MGVRSVGRKLNHVRVFAHCIGARIVSTEKNVGWVNIPRCASSTLKLTALPTNKYIYVESPYVFDEKMQFTTIIRDPWKRYISGFIHGLRNTGWLWHAKGRKSWLPESAYYSESGLEVYLKPEFIYESIFETGLCKPKGLGAPFLELTQKFPLVLDEHTAPFSLLLGPFRRNNIDMIDADNNLIGELKQRLGVKEVRSRNITQDKYKCYTEFLNFFIPRLKANQKWMSAWQELFSEDIWIYKNKSIRRYHLYEEFLVRNFNPHFYKGYI